ncbi:MAG: acyl carrier protein [Clostridia bacterium]|nr:acyl carrier protein [Clostridia bacterium]
MFETKLKEIIANQLSVSIEDIHDDDDIMDDLMADSLDIVEMVMEVEDTFNIQISD